MIYRQAYTTLERIRTLKDIVSTDDDTTIARFIYDSSNAIQSYCDRVFEPYLQTQYYDVPTTRRLVFDDDLLSLTSLSDGSGALSASGYVLQPYNETPYRNATLTNTVGFWQWTDTPLRAITAVGVWGYHRYYPRAWKVATTISQAVTTTTQTTIHITSSANCGTLSLIKIGDEIMRVTTHGNPSIVVERAQNGTTATTHLNGSTVYVWAVEDVIQDACERLTIYAYDNREKAGQDEVQVVDGAVFVSTKAPQNIKRALNRYVKMKSQAVG